MYVKQQFAVVGPLAGTLYAKGIAHHHIGTFRDTQLISTHSNQF